MYPVRFTGPRPPRRRFRGRLSRAPILHNSAAKSGLINYKAPFVLERNFTTNFSVKWMDKDIGLMLERGQELGVPLLLTGLTRQLFQTAIAAGHGDEDICSTIKVLESLAGVEVVFQK